MAPVTATSKVYFVAISPFRDHKSTENSCLLAAEMADRTAWVQRDCLRFGPHYEKAMAILTLQ